MVIVYIFGGRSFCDTILDENIDNEINYLLYWALFVLQMYVRACVWYQWRLDCFWTHVH